MRGSITITFIEFMCYVFKSCAVADECIQSFIDCIKKHSKVCTTTTAVICYNELRKCLREKCRLIV